MSLATGDAGRPTGSDLECSVVIPAYNAERWIRKTLDGALDQVGVRHEVIVVDDGSTDGTLEILRGYGSQITLLSQENSGVAAARNAGVRVAGSPYLAFLDADDLWSRNKLERQLAVFEDAPGLVLVHCGITLIDSADQPIDGTILLGLEGEVHRELFLQEPVIYGGGSGAVFARWAFDRVGGFDERFGTSADWHLWLRITALGRVGLVADPLLGYRIHDSNMHANVDAEARDMFRGLREAVAGDPMVAGLGNRALAKCHRTIAGGYWKQRSVSRALRHAAAAIVREPSSIVWFGGRFGRRLGRA